jgi:GNAT superfamily N-acetyltransferase
MSSTNRYYVHVANPSQTFPEHTEIIELPNNDYTFTLQQLAKSFTSSYSIKFKLPVELDSNNGHTGVKGSNEEEFKLNSIVNAACEDREDIFLTLRKVQLPPRRAVQSNNAAARNKPQRAPFFQAPPQLSPPETLSVVNLQLQLHYLHWNSATSLKSATMQFLAKQFPSLYATALQKLALIELIRAAKGMKNELPCSLILTLAGTETILGHIHIFPIEIPNECAAVATALAILPDYRKKGLGKLLLQRAAEILRVTGGEALYISCPAESEGFVQASGGEKATAPHDKLKKDNEQFYKLSVSK